MASQTSLHRLRKELRVISRNPPDHITARPLPSNILTWYFVLEGPPNSVYAGGSYLGRLAFPEEYPYKPPAVYMLSPQGRFKVDTMLCLSMSNFHPETWSPAWSVGAVLTGLLTFMLLEEDTYGSITTSDKEKRALARSSHAWNGRSKMFAEVFPEFMEREAAAAAKVASAESASARARTARSAATVLAGNNGVVAQLGAAGEGGRRRRGESDKESLGSLIAWLAVFVGVIFYVFTLITKPV